MAATTRKPIDLSEIVGDEPQEAAESTRQPAKRATGSPRKRSAAKTTKKASKRAQKAAEPAGDAAAGAIQVRAVSTDEAKRASLYLHPDDWRAIMQIKIDEGVDLNSYVRALIALARGDKKVYARAVKLAKTAPRGGY